MGQGVSFRNKMNAQYSEAKSCLSAVKSFQEYCESYTKKVLTFLEGSDSDPSSKLAVQVKLDDYHGKVAAVTKQVYETALNDESAEIQLVVDDLSDTITVTGADIVQAVEDSLAEVKVQSEYIKLCLQSVETRSSELATNIKAKFSSIKGDLINKYQDLWVSGNPLRSLQNLFNSSKVQTITQDSNGQIDIFDTSGYGATNVWITAFEEIGDTIAGFFEGVWQGIQDLGGFFNRLLDSFVNLATWLMKKAFGQLFTNYENGGDRIGYIDVPLLQIPICNINFPTDGAGSYIASPMLGDEYNRAVVGGLAYNYRVNRSDGYINNLKNIMDNNWDNNNYAEIHSAWTDVTLNCSSDVRETLYENLGLIQLFLNMQGITGKLYEFIGDDTNPRSTLLCKTVDIVVPCSSMPELFSSEESYSAIPFSPHDVLIRFGLKKIGMEGSLEVYAVVMQIFAMATWEDVNSVPDVVNTCRMRDTLYALYSYLSETYWCVTAPDLIPPVPWSNARLHTMIDNAVKEIIDISDIDRSIDPSTDPDELVSRLKLLDDLSTLTSRTSSGPWHTFLEYGNAYNPTPTLNVLLLIQAIIMYSGSNGPGLPVLTNNGDVRINKLDTILVIDSYQIVPWSQQQYSSVVNWPFWSFDPGSISSDYPLQVNESLGDQLYVENMAAFTPYCSYYGYGVSVHYQTSAERVSEAKFIIVAAIIAIVGVTLAVLTKKFLRNRQVKLEIAQAARDSFAWDLPSNPSASQIKEYKRLRKKANRISKLNGLFGLSSDTDSSNSIIDSISAISDQLLATQGASQDGENDVPTLRVIHKDIVG